MKNLVQVTLPLCLCVLVVGSWLVSAGDLDPPAGPVVPTMKPLDVVEPRIPIDGATTPGDGISTFVISQPGSYYFTGNLSGEAGKSGIAIAADDVTLDLCGFVFQGVPGTLNGIRVTFGVTNLTVRNGTLRHWDATAIEASNATDARFERLTCADNQRGLIARGATVARCSFYGNDLTGMTSSGQCAISSCTARDNGLSGFNLGDGDTITGCTSSDNAGRGIGGVTGNITVTACTATENQIHGFDLPRGSVLRGCTARQNTTDGFFLADGCAAIDCVASDNGSDGFDSQGDVTYQRCTADGNGNSGFNAFGAMSASDCLASGNGANGFGPGAKSRISSCSAIANGGNGMQLLDGCVIVDCEASGNDLMGFNAAGSSRVTIRDCSAAENSSHGIMVSSDCRLTGNACTENSDPAAIGIAIIAGGNHVEGNTVIGNGTGISTTGSDNLFLDNRARDNGTDYSIGGGNAFGPILDVGGGGEIGAGAVPLLPYSNYRY